MKNKNKSAGIIATGSYLPKNILSNLDLKNIIDTSDEWIFSKTGIRERRIADSNEVTSDLAANAAREALSSANLKPDDIELIIVATTTPDMPMPACACIVQDKICAKNAGAFDLIAVSAGFVYSLIVASQFVISGSYKNVLVIGAEICSRFVNYKDRNTCIFFGDGAGAVVISQVEEGYGLLSYELGSDGSGAEYLKIPAGGTKMPPSKENVENNLHCVYMDGKKVRDFATSIPILSLTRTLEKLNMKTENIDLLISHQSNANIIREIAEKLNILQDKIFTNIERVGNTGSASVAIALDDAVKQKKLKTGDILALLGYGAGLCWASALFRW